MNVKLVFFIIPSIAFSQLNDVDSKITLNKDYRGIASVDCIAVNYFGSKEVGFKEKKEIIQYDHYLKIISTAFETQQEGKEKRHEVLRPIVIENRITSKKTFPNKFDSKR